MARGVLNKTEKTFRAKLFFLLVPPSSEKPVASSVKGAVGLAKVNVNAAILDLHLLKTKPDYLADKRVMQYFIALNNCQDLNIEKKLQNEISYPALAEFYKPKVMDILAESPAIVTQALYTTPNTGAAALTDGTDVDVLSLGEYFNGVEFQLVFSPGRESRLMDRKNPGDLRAGRTHDVYLFDYQGGKRLIDFRSKEPSTCPAANQFLEGDRVAFSSKRLGDLPDSYSVRPDNFNLKLSALSMNSKDANAYIEGHPVGRRRAYLLVYVRLSNFIDYSKSADTRGRDFAGKIVRVAVIDYLSDKILGYVFEDNSPTSK